MFGQVTAVNLQKPNQWKSIVTDDLVAAGASLGDNGYGVSFDMKDKDSRYVVIVNNTSDSASATVAVKPGNGINATTHTPSVTLSAGDTAVIQLESGCFKQVKDEGAMKVESPSASIVEKVFITSTTASVKVHVLHLAL